MAIFWDAPVSPDAITAEIRRQPLPDNLSLTAAFPVEFEDTNTIDFVEIVETNRAAQYRAFDGRIHVSRRDAGSERRVSLAPLSTSLTMGEYERLRLEFARTAGTNLSALARAIYNDAARLTREVQNRIELAWGDVLTDGKFTPPEAGLTEADYGMPANHLKTPATLWTNVAAAILDDLIAWSDDYATGVAKNGVRPATMKTSLLVRRAMQRNQQLIGAIHGSTSGKMRVSLAEMNDLFVSEGVPVLEAEPYDTVLDVGGTSTPVIPSDRVVFLPQDLAALGALKMGVSATAMELVDSADSDLTFEQAAGIVGVVDKDGPPYREQTLVDAVGMPVLKNARLLMIADVA